MWSECSTGYPWDSTHIAVNCFRYSGSYQHYSCCSNRSGNRRNNWCCSTCDPSWSGYRSFGCYRYIDGFPVYTGCSNRCNNRGDSLKRSTCNRCWSRYKRSGYFQSNCGCWANTGCSTPDRYRSYGNNRRYRRSCSSFHSHKHRHYRCNSAGFRVSNSHHQGDSYSSYRHIHSYSFGCWSSDNRCWSTDRSAPQNRSTVGYRVYIGCSNLCNIRR